jgi:3-isopropylmalate/(R)-2-methylmalate dehydratase small subunit
MIIKGKAIKYGDDINTDVIIPGRFLNNDKFDELALHAMEDLDMDFKKKFSKGDIIVAGKNFGCGSSREQAAIILRYIGVGCIITKSFARIFFRNAINQGIPIIESSKAVESIDSNDELFIDYEIGLIKNLTKNLHFKIQPYPKFIQEIISKGGLIYWLQEKI